MGSISTNDMNASGNPVTTAAANFDAIARSIMPRPIVARGGRIEELQSKLPPEEARFVKDAVPRRVEEFTAGRTCAREALAELGLPGTAIPMGSRRQPLWPRGIVGSISHGAGYCVAAVCERSRFAGLGVDIESPAPLPDSLLDLVCTGKERTWCERRGKESVPLLAKFLFSAKEAVFKCLYPVFGQELDFHDVTLDLDVHGSRFLAHVPAAVLETDSDVELRGRLACTPDFLMTSTALNDLDFMRLRKPDPATRPVSGWTHLPGAVPPC